MRRLIAAVLIAVALPLAACKPEKRCTEGEVRIVGGDVMQCEGDRWVRRDNPDRKKRPIGALGERILARR